MATYSKVSIIGSFKPYYYQERDNDISSTATNHGYEKEIIRIDSKTIAGGKRYIKDVHSTIHSQKTRTMSHDLWDAAYPMWDASSDGNMLCWNETMTVGDSAINPFEELSGSATIQWNAIYIENTGSTNNLLISSKLSGSTANWGIIVPPGVTWIAPTRDPGGSGVGNTNIVSGYEFYCKCASSESTTIKAILI
tara:strand:- start:443 stop:1024 length:582 start_codon:yes stop_codon:yes gene_type:complete